MVVGHGNDVALHLGNDGVIGLDDGKIGIDHYLDRGVFELFDYSFPVFRFGDPAEIVGEVVLTPGVLNMGVEFSPFSHEMIASSQQVPRCSHIGRIGIGHGDHASSKQDCDFAGIDFVIFGFTAVNGFHVQGMAQDEGDAVLAKEIGGPIPGSPC